LAPHLDTRQQRPTTDVDTTAADMLEDLDEHLNAPGISLVLAELKDPVRIKIERYELTRTIDPRTSFPPSATTSPRSATSSRSTGPEPSASRPDDPGPSGSGGGISPCSEDVGGIKV
jgi:hypothetical protein